MSRRGRWTGPAVMGFSIALLLAPVASRAQAPVRDSVTGAAERFGLTPDLILAVIRAESGGDPRAVSSKGAMGLMQLMPATWAQLRAQLALGPDPFDPHDNVMAGAAYLRALFDRYGSPGFLAAYNAGPGRYEASLAGRALPQETLDYVARVQGDRGFAGATALDWRGAGLFAPAWSGRLGPVRGEVPAAGNLNDDR